MIIRKILLAGVALAGLGLAQPQAQAAIFIANVSAGNGNDCTGVFGTGAGCVATGTFNGTTLTSAPLIAKFDFNGNNVSQTTIGSAFVGTINGSEFTFTSAPSSGILNFSFAFGSTGVNLLYAAVKASTEFNLFSVFNSDTVFTPLNNQGNPRGVSHISFYGVPGTPPVTVPEPASLLLFGAGLLGLGVARRARRAA